MGTPSAAAIAVSISARMAMLLASSSGSSSLRARLVQSRAALCASVVIIEGFSALSSTLLAFGSSQDAKESGCGQHIPQSQPRPAACGQRISLVLVKPSFLNKRAHGLDTGAADFSTQHFKFKLKTLQ
jgi:hypothetical protein